MGGGANEGKVEWERGEEDEEMGKRRKNGRGKGRGRQQRKESEAREGKEKGAL